MDLEGTAEQGAPMIRSFLVHPDIARTREELDNDFDHWYPDWETWKFRRTLSYWISVLYTEGSILFTVGAGFSLFRKMDESGKLIGYSHPFGLVAVDGPYLVGGVCFTIGSYMGVLELINVPNREGRMDYFFWGPKHWQKLKEHLHWESLASYMCYLTGALFFNVMTIAPYIHWLHERSFYTVSLTALFGGLGFTIGGLLECKENEFWKCRVSSIYWWICFMNFGGGILFLVAGIGYIVGATDHGTWSTENSFWAICFTYFVGSAMYWIGSFLSLWLWKNEQFGLSKAPEMNTGERMKEPSEDEQAMQRQYGCGKSDTGQLPWLLMYLVNATASVLNVGFVALYERSGSQLDYSHALAEGIFNFFLSHGIMLLGSVIHHTPTVKPFNWLLIYMRILLLCITANGWVNVVKNVVEHSDCVWAPGTGCGGHHQ